MNKNQNVTVIARRFSAVAIHGLLRRLCLLAMTMQVTASNAAPIKVETYTVTEQPFKEHVTLLGDLKAHREATLKSPGSGVLTKILVTEGSQVKKNQILAEIDSSGLRKSLGDTKTGVQVKRNRLRRLEKLYQHGDISLKDLEDARGDLAVAEHELSGAKLKAPFAGECGVFTHEVGSHLSAGETVVSVYDTSELLLYFSVPETLLPKLRIGQHVTVKENEGTLTSLEGRLNPKTHQAFAKASLKSCPGCIIGAKVPVKISLSEEAITIPSEAVFIRDKKSYVFKVVDSKAKLTPVTTGTRSKKQIAILTGLHAGDAIILRGHSKIHHDDTVY